MKNIKFLGIPIIKIRKREHCEKRYFLGIQYKVKKIANQYKSFLDGFKENAGFIRNRKIQVNAHNLGETVIYARTAKYWLEKDALVFGIHPQHVEIFKMYAPEIPLFYCGKGNFENDTADALDNHFKILLSSKDLEVMNLERKPFWTQYEKFLGVDFSKLDIKPAVIEDSERKMAMQKLKALHINTKKYVFMTTKAKSLEHLPDFFWNDLEKELRKMGYDIVYNSQMFTLAEAYVIAQNSKALISLRSGFNDVLSEVKVPQFMIYTRNPFYGDLQPMYSLKDFPWVEKELIHEYNTLYQPIKEIKQDILDKIKTGKK